MNYLTVEQIIETNKAVTGLSNDPFAVFHPANLEHIVEAVRYKYENNPDAVLLKAAYLLDALANKGHVFAEGNKRTAVTATFTFLEQNGCELEPKDEDEVFYFVLEVAQNKHSLNGIKAWLQQRVKMRC
ncbi:MAG: type II toxin-antitoxin system death-on-curing family toxin [Candidatus Micrarchaeota archaeon]